MNVSTISPGTVLVQTVFPIISVSVREITRDFNRLVVRTQLSDCARTDVFIVDKILIRVFVKKKN